VRTVAKCYKQTNKKHPYTCIFKLYVKEHKPYYMLY